MQAPLKEAWHLDVPAGGPNHQFGLSEPILAGEMVIAASPTEVIGVDVSSGQRAWSVPREYGPSVSPALATVGGKQVVVFTEGFGSNPPGSTPSASTPGVTASSTVVSPTSSDTSSPGVSGSAAASTPSGSFDSHFAAFDLGTRRLLWEPVALARVSRTGVTVDGDTAFVGDNAGTVSAIDLATGHVRWTHATSGYLDTALAASSGKLFVTVQGSRTTPAAIVALNETDGSQAWRYEAGRDVLVSAPSVGAGAVLAAFAGLQASSVRAIDASTGVVRWESPVNNVPTPFGAPAVTTDGVVGLDVNAQAYRFDLATGDRMWDFALNEPAIRTSPVVSGGQVLVATSAGTLAALDAGTGELVWRTASAGDLLRDPLVTSDLVVLVRGGAHPGLVAFTHDPAGALERVPSPTTLDPVKLFGAFVLAAVPLAALLVLSGRWLLARSGPAFDESAGAEDADAWDEVEETGTTGDQEDRPSTSDEDGEP